MNELKFKIYTDGSCKGNPGPGGWGVIIIDEFMKEKELSGYSYNTTNNRMELQAVIEGIKHLKTELTIHIYTDSIYVMYGMTKWIQKWRLQDWKNSKNKIIKNIDLWQKLYNLSVFFDIKWHWVKGHSTNIYNVRADKLASDAALSII